MSTHDLTPDEARAAYVLCLETWREALADYKAKRITAKQLDAADANVDHAAQLYLDALRTNPTQLELAS